MSEATVFSQSRQLVFEKPVTRADIEKLLMKMMEDIGEPVSYNKVILGHIKVLARFTNEDDYLFLSLTRLNQVDSKVSPGTFSDSIDRVNLNINVLVFGYSMETVEKVVTAALQKVCNKS